MRLDDFADARRSEGVLLLKIDTEGHDWEVLQGAQQLLDAHQVAAITFEIAGQMNGAFFRIHKEHASISNTAAFLRARSTEPNLQSLVRWLDERGFDSFFMGSRSLVPISGEW